MHKMLKRTLLSIVTKHNMHIFRVSLFFASYKSTLKQLNGENCYVGYIYIICFWLSCFVLLFWCLVQNTITKQLKANKYPTYHFPLFSCTFHCLTIICLNTFFFFFMYIFLCLLLNYHTFNLTFIYMLH